MMSGIRLTAPSGWSERKKDEEYKTIFGTLLYERKSGKSSALYIYDVFGDAYVS